MPKLFLLKTTIYRGSWWGEGESTQSLLGRCKVFISEAKSSLIQYKKFLHTQLLHSTWYFSLCFIFLKYHSSFHKYDCFFFPCAVHCPSFCHKQNFYVEIIYQKSKTGTQSTTRSPSPGGRSRIDQSLMSQSFDSRLDDSRYVDRWIYYYMDVAQDFHVLW